MHTQYGPIIYYEPTRGGYDGHAGSEERGSRAAHVREEASLPLNPGLAMAGQGSAWATAAADAQEVRVTRRYPEYRFPLAGSDGGSARGRLESRSSQSFQRPRTVVGPSGQQTIVDFGDTA